MRWRTACKRPRKRRKAEWRRQRGASWPWAAWGARLAVGALRLAWRLVRPPLRWALQVVLALLILLEEWGWQPLAELLGRLVRWRPWARLEAAIAGLPPYAALVVFALPSLLLMPLKFLALFLIAKGQLVLAGLLFAGAKVVATALVARLFMLTRPALMQIAWFAWAYNRFVPWKEALEAYVRTSTVWRVGRIWKARAKRVRGGAVAADAADGAAAAGDGAGDAGTADCAGEVAQAPDQGALGGVGALNPSANSRVRIDTHYRDGEVDLANPARGTPAHPPASARTRWTWAA